MHSLKLYTTTGCHLCEQAEALLQTLHKQGLCQWRAVEIADTDELIEQYGIRIPVVANSDTGEDLGWPFTLEQLLEWLTTPPN